MAQNHNYIPAGGEDARGNKPIKNKNTYDSNMVQNHNITPAGGEDARVITRITYDTNNVYTEDDLDIKETIRLTVRNRERIQTELFAHLDYLNLLQHTVCTQHLQESEQSYEIKTKEGTSLEDFKKILNQQPIITDRKTLNITPTRKLKDIRKESNH